MLRLGSLFSGSGGFELAGTIHGITPVWASEIEPYPIRVTKARFPNMKHLGNVTKINGAEIQPVDIITFGSPCQDMSVAGKRAGIQDGKRSNLFFEAIRIIKEMRNATDNIYPRIAVWENVPGAFSSNKGEDFRSVLQAFAGIRNETANVPQPPRGKWHGAGCIVGDGWSIAWRSLDARFWGVPQRRRRIYLIADFGSERAGEILFERKGVRWDTAQGEETREGTANDAARSAGRSCGAFCAGASALAGSIGWSETVSPTLKGANAGLSMHAVVQFVDCRNLALTPECGTLQAKDGGGTSLNYSGAVLFSQQSIGEYKKSEDACTMLARQYRSPTDLIVSRVWRKYILRRLTPLEACRLQGFPDWWEDGANGSDSARYRMWGNGIALPCAAHVIGCAKKLIGCTP